MAVKPIESRLASILPEAASAPTAAEQLALEPMPAEDVIDPAVTDTSEPGTPFMEEGVQVAGIFSKGAGVASDALNRIVKQTGKKAERELVPGAGLTPGELPDPAKAGRFKLIPEADATLTNKVDAAVQARQASGDLTGKPGGVPDEPFNLSRYQTDDAAAIVGGVADALNIKTKAVTFDEIKAKAEANGISEGFLSRLIGNDGKMMANAVETYKALEVLESSANELDRLFKLVATGNATDAEKLQLRQQISFHGLIQKGVKGMQTETARALAVFRIPREGNAQAIRQVLDEFGGDAALQDMARSYLSLESRAAQNALVEKSMASGVKDVWFTTYINGLLSSPVSHAKNIVGNAMFGLYQMPERFVASLYSNVLPDGVRSWKSLIPGSAEEKIAFSEALTMAQSLTVGIREGLELASKAWRTNTPNDLMSKIELQRGQQEGLGATLQRVTGSAPDTWLGKAFDFYGTAVTLPGRALMTEDEFFKGAFYRMELNTQIQRRGRQVYDDAIQSGMPEAQAAAKMEAEMASLYANPPADLDSQAAAFAQKGTFTAELPPALQSLQKVFNHPALKIVVPFFKTPANIGLQVIERTPFAPLSSQWRDELAKGGVYRDMALAKVTLGSGLLATFASAAKEGYFTGRGPERAADKEALKRDGWQPYSLKVGDKWVSYAGMEPISAFLAIAADYAEYSTHEPDADKIEEVFLGATYGMYQYLGSQPYLQGLADVAKLFGKGAGSGDTVNGENIVNGLAKQLGGFVIGGSPAGAYNSMLAGIERLLDPTAKDTRASPDLPMGVRGFVEAYNKYRQRLPYFNAELPEQLTLWGDPVQQGQGAAYELVLPTRVTRQNFSQVDDLLVRMGSPVGMPERKIQGVELTAEQYNRLLTIYGKETDAKRQLLDTMTSAGFQQLNLDDQQKFVQRVHSRFMDEARQRLIGEYPDIQMKIDDLTEARKAQGIYYKP